MKKVLTVYVSPLEMDSTEYHLVDLPAAQDSLDTLLLEMNKGFPLYIEVSDYCGREYLADHMPEDMDLKELNLLAGKLAEFDPTQEAAFEGLVRMDLDKGVTELPLCRLVDLANSVDCCHVAPGVGNDVQLGHFYVDNDFPVIPPGLPEELYEILDYHAYRKQNISTDQRWDRLLDKLDGKELTPNSDANGILSEMMKSLQIIRNRRMLWSVDIIELNKKISTLSSQNQVLATLKQQGLIDPDIFISQSNELTKQLRDAKLSKERLLAADSDNTIDLTKELMEILDAGPDILNNFDKELFGDLIDMVIVDSNEQLRFRLKNGLELVETIERTIR